MKLAEYEGKKLFEKHGIPVPRGVVLTEFDMQELGPKLRFIRSENIIIKSQILTGGRFKAGAVKFATKTTAREVINTLLGKSFKGCKVKKVLVERKLNILKEHYLAITIDRSKKCFVLIFSKEGGVDIEILAKTQPEKICKIYFDEFDPNALEKACKYDECKEILHIAKQLFLVIKENDATLAEINPLVYSDEGWFAADSKVVIDDNSLYRQEEFQKQSESSLSEIEKTAKEYKINYVELDGDIAVIGNGAGLVMATLDVLNHFDLKPANFLDIGGGADVRKVGLCLNLALEHKNLKALFINVFGGITHCDDVANGIIDYVKANKISIPIVTRMIGTNDELAKQILHKHNFVVVDSMEEGVKKIKELIS
ncbi:hypothetical protein HN587_02205 [Candidatus Woesearchaeota archaeon]|jgi:succinyl-CoA synthetase beta subunit|nr:hypothetical protein [Candidatus Woesearchaeota archaeon]